MRPRPFAQEKAANYEGTGRYNISTPKKTEAAHNWEFQRANRVNELNKRRQETDWEVIVPPLKIQ